MALELGRTLGELADMPEAEFTVWCRYRARRMFPSRRRELILANLAMLIDVHMGGASNVTLADYLFDPKREGVDEDDDED